MSWVKKLGNQGVVRKLSSEIRRRPVTTTTTGDNDDDDDNDNDDDDNDGDDKKEISKKTIIGVVSCIVAKDHQEATKSHFINRRNFPMKLLSRR